MITDQLKPLDRKTCTSQGRWPHPSATLISWTFTLHFLHKTSLPISSFLQFVVCNLWPFDIKLVCSRSVRGTLSVGGVSDLVNSSQAMWRVSLTNVGGLLLPVPLSGVFMLFFKGIPLGYTALNCTHPVFNILGYLESLAISLGWLSVSWIGLGEC